MAYQKLLDREGIQVHPIGEISITSEIVELNGRRKCDEEQGIGAEDGDKGTEPLRLEGCCN